MANRPLPELNTSPLGGPLGGKRAQNGDAKLPSKEALSFLTRKPPTQQRILEFGNATPLGKGARRRPRGGFD